MLLSVIICTHNPREVYLSRVLAALKVQSLPDECWELLIVDNASTKAVSPLVDLAWKPKARVVEEKALGLTNARLRGIAETVGELMVFVDDDNVLAANYLSVAARIANEHQKLGVWGGQCIGEFESPPPAEISVYLGSLAVRTFTGEKWGNDLRNEPIGAGLCVRRNVAEKYAGNVAQDQRRRQLGRIGANLSSCEDTDIALTSLEMGLGVGLFADLILTHIIPAWRLDPAYLNRLIENSSYSRTMLNLIRDGKPKKRQRTWRHAIFYRLATFCKSWLTEPDRRKYLKELRKGEARALRDYNQALSSAEVPVTSHDPKNPV